MTQIETTLGALATAAPALDQLTRLPLKIKSAYSLAKLARLVNQELEVYEKQRLALVTKHGDVREATPEEVATGVQGQVTQVRPSELEAFSKALAELRSLSVIIPWQPITLDDLDGQAVRASDLMQLGPLFS